MRSLYITITFLAALIQPATAAGTLQSANWSQVDSISKDTSVSSNAIRIQKAGLKWNGKAVSEDQVRGFIHVVANDFSKQPLLYLIYDRGISQEDVAKIKAIIAQELNCNPKICLEIISSTNYGAGIGDLFY